MSEAKTSKVNPEAIIDLTPEQKADLKPFVEAWQTSGGLVIGSMAKRGETVKVGFRQLPIELGEKIIQIVDDYYEGESDGNL